MTKDQVNQVALNARLGANAKSTDVVGLIWRNLTGADIDAKNLADLSGLLDAKVLTAAQLATKAADLDLTAQVINLVGLGQSGWEYIPYGGYFTKCRFNRHFVSGVCWLSWFGTAHRNRTNFLENTLYRYLPKKLLSFNYHKRRCSNSSVCWLA